MKHAGKIILSEKEVLDYLGYPTGKLHFFGRSEDYAGIAAVVEHPDLPELHEWSTLELVLARGIYWNVKDHYLLRISAKPNWISRITSCAKAAVYCWRLHKEYVSKSS